MEPAGYSRRTLAEKLGLRPGMRACIIGAPDGFLAAVGDVANHLQLTHDPDVATSLDYAHLFVVERGDLVARVPRLKAALAPRGMLWISWPKRTSGVPTDVDEHVVREIGLAAGLVDVKVAAIDPVWSAFKFVFRVRDRA